MNDKQYALMLAAKRGEEVRKAQARSLAEMIATSARERPGKSVYGPNGPISEPAVFGLAKPFQTRPTVTTKIKLKTDAGRGSESPIGGKIW